MSVSVTATVQCQSQSIDKCQFHSECQTRSRSDKTNENGPYHVFVPTSAIEHVIKAVKISIKENPSNMTL